MTKKEYMKPTMQVVELQHKYQIMAGSLTNGMNNKLQTEEEVEEGW